MSYTVSLIDETWGKTTPRQIETFSDLATAKARIASWADKQAKHVRSFGLRPTVDIFPVSEYPASVIISWVEKCELVVTIAVVAVEVKD